MALNKITDGQLSTYGVISAPDRLTGDANQNKLVFDRLIRSVVAVYFNALVDALTSASGAGEIGAAVDGIEESNVLGVLAALKALQDSASSSQGATNQNIQNALDNRYTKDQANALLNEKVDTTTANELVKSIKFDSDSGVFTITTMGGAVTTIDTMIEKVPAGFSFEGNQLVLTLEDGTKQYADLSSFIDTYTFTDGGTIVFSQTGKNITAEVKDGSLALSKLQPEIKATLESYAVRAEDAQEKAAAAQTKAEAARDTAQGAATTATTKAAEVSSNTATAALKAKEAADSAAAAKNSETNAQKQAEALFTANVNEEGHLVYTKPSGESKDLGNVKGDKGDTGDSGVYIGETEPTNEAVKVWINPAGTGLVIPITIEQSDYDALVEAGKAEEDQIYYVVPDGTLEVTA